MPPAKMPTDIMKPAEEQESLIGPIDRNRERKYGTYAYKTEYDKIIFNLLSKSSTAKNKSHCCNALQCARTTFNRWLEKYPTLNEAFETGMEIGKKRWMDKIQKHAFKPTTQVNNGLIKLLSAVVYGIKIDSEPSVVVNNNVNSDPEKEMKDRGIPIPKVDVEDVEDD